MVGPAATGIDAASETTTSGRSWAGEGAHSPRGLDQTPPLSQFKQPFVVDTYIPQLWCAMLLLVRESTGQAMISHFHVTCVLCNYLCNFALV